MLKIVKAILKFILKIFLSFVGVIWWITTSILVIYFDKIDYGASMERLDNVFDAMFKDL